MVKSTSTQLPAPETAKTLQQLREILEASFKSLPLATKPEDIVPGEGSEEAELMFIGEAPGYYESVQRRPFVGRSGQLLRQTMTQVGLAPETVFISNIVKVRPPDNRDPFPEEITAFKPFLDQEIRLIQPRMIVTLGRFSMAKFLPEVKVSQVHSRLHKISWMGQPEKPTYVLPMYHPAAALRSTQLKNSFIADFEKIPKILEWVKNDQEVESLKSEINQTLL